MGLKRNNSKSVGLLAKMTQICGAPTGGEITEKNTKVTTFTFVAKKAHN
eukprot:SAG25_NODE_6008_length_596_cov_10.386318_1_plen_48_part_01